MYCSLTVFSWCENTAILAYPWYFVREKANLKRLDYHFDKRVFCICFNSLRDTRFYLFYITSAAISGDSSMFPSLRTMIKHYRHARRQGLIGEYLRVWPYCIYRTSVPSSDCEMCDSSLMFTQSPEDGTIASRHLCIRHFVTFRHPCDGFATGDGKEYFPFMIVCNQLAEFLNEDMKKRLV